MNARKLIDHIRRYVPLSPKEEEIILDLIKVKKFQKGEFVVQAGDICMECSFVVSGCLKSYRTDDSGKEHVVSFAIENWWTGDLGSFCAQQPADYHVQCLEDSDLAMFHYDVMEQLYQEVPIMERFFRLLLMRSYVATQRRVVDGMSIPAKQLFIQFSTRYPEMMQRIPQYLIAAYLGITPQFLSKIRRDLAEE